MTYRVGASASPAAGAAMARYLLTETLKPEHEAMARYYAGEMPPLPASLVEELAQGLNRGDTGYAEALDELVRAELALIPSGQAIDNAGIRARIEEELTAATTRDNLAREIAAQGGTVAELRPDLPPALAERLGITDPGQLLSETGIAHLLNGRRLDGGEIAGKEVHKARLNIAEIFGLDPRLPVSGEAVRNVLAGKRADGDVPKAANGRALEEKVVEGARKRFRAAMGIPAHRDATPDEVAHLVAGRTATGGMVDANDYRRQIHATRPPVGFVDLTFSADKSLSVAWALAPTEAERAALLDIHRHAVADAMAHVEHRIGVARKGAGGKNGVEPGKLGWISFQHYTARPAVDIVRTDSEGRAYTDPREVPLQTADPQLHTHCTVFNAVLTDSGRLGSIDLDRLDGFVKEGGAIYQAAVATRARRAGIDVVLDSTTGAARLSDIPSSVRDMFSKRSREALSAARELAHRKGADWDSLSGEQQIALIKAGAGETRNAKDKRSAAGEGQSDFAVWCEQAKVAGHRHHSVLRPDEIRPEPSPEQRHGLAYEASQPLIAREFGQRAKLDGQDLRVMAARGLIASGIGDRPGEDIAAVLKAYARRGVRQDGTQTGIVMGKEAPLRGKERWSVTTSLHEDRERELIGLARTAAADRSTALTPKQINDAADAFLARNPAIDPAGAHWQAQREMMLRLATGGRLGVGIGAAGSGKSTALEPLVDAWKADGRQVFGATVAWRQASDLGAAGIAAKDRAALAPFLKGIETGRYAPDRNSVVVIDEVGLVGTRQQLELMRLQKKHGFQLVQLGDEKQCQSVEAGPVIDLLRKALGEDQIPQILTLIRQKTERERTITGLFREGRAAEALEMKREDGTALLVAGGWDATAQRVAQLWHDRMQANRDDAAYRLTVSAETNVAARDIGMAIRAIRQQTGEIGADHTVISAMDRSGATSRLALATGDQVRLFDRVHDAGTPGRAKVLGNNGEVVEIREITDTGMRVRNAAGDEGVVAWSKLRERPGEPVRLAYGYAATVNVSQGITSTEHIHASVSGHGLTTYTALSRHQRAGWLVVDDAAVRRRIHAGHMKTGRTEPIRLPDVWTRIGEEMSQQPVKASALDMLTRATDVRRGSVARFQRSMEVAERMRGMPGIHLSSYERARLALSPVMRQMAGYAQEVTQRLSQGLAWIQERPQPTGQREEPGRKHEHRGPRMRM